MRRDYNWELVNLIQNRISIKYNLERLYNNNLGFIHKTIRQCNVLNNDLKDDLLQVAFFAVYDSAVKFDLDKETNYLYYLRLWLIHYFYQELLRMQYSFRISERAYKEAKRLDKLSTFRAVDISYLTTADITYGIENGSLVSTLHFEDFCKNSLSKEIWSIVKKSITPKNYVILIDRFVNQLSYECIGKKYGIGKERVRLRVLRSLNKLKDNKELQIIAMDWYGIKIQ